MFVNTYRDNPVWLSPTIDTLSAILSLIGMIVGALIVILQLRVTHRQSLELQRKEHRKQLHLDIYSVMSDVVYEAQSGMSKASGDISWTVNSINIYWNNKNLGIDSSPIRERLSELLEYHQVAVDGYISVISILERYEIAAPAFKLFSEATKCEIEELHELWRKFSDSIWKFLPYDIFESRHDTPSASRTTKPARPTEDQLEKIRASKNYQDKAIDFIGYYMDVSRGLQNILLGDIFEHRIKPRYPANLTAKVLDFGDI